MNIFGFNSGNPSSISYVCKLTDVVKLEIQTQVFQLKLHIYLVYPYNNSFLSIRKIALVYEKC